MSDSEFTEERVETTYSRTVSVPRGDIDFVITSRRDGSGLRWMARWMDFRSGVVLDNAGPWHVGLPGFVYSTRLEAELACSVKLADLTRSQPLEQQS